MTGNLWGQMAVWYSVGVYIWTPHGYPNAQALSYVNKKIGTMQ